MTNLEAYKAIFSKYGSSVSDADTTADLGLLGIDPNGTYDVSESCALYGGVFIKNEIMMKGAG